MPSRAQATPPRAVQAGDVITGFSLALDAWTAGQITAVDATTRCVGVLELNWYGAAPATVDDVRDAALVHEVGGYSSGRLAHFSYPWLLPRSVTVIGSLPPIVTGLPNTFAYWTLGSALARVRWRAAGNRGPFVPPFSMELRGDDIAGVLRGAERPETRQLKVVSEADIDLSNLARIFPELRSIDLESDLNALTNPAEINALVHLRHMALTNVFGMTADDVPYPDRLPHLESLSLDGVPAEYAAAVRRAWRPEVPRGTALDIRGARTQEWVEENRRNPLRQWDGRDHISARNYARTIAQLRDTRSAILAAFENAIPGKRIGAMSEIGREFAERINYIASRSHFIETEEREDLFAALEAVLHEAPSAERIDVAQAWTDLTEAIDRVRDW